MIEIHIFKETAEVAVVVVPSPGTKQSLLDLIEDLLQPPAPVEADTILSREFGPGIRLACRALPIAGASGRIDLEILA